MPLIRCSGWFPGCFYAVAKVFWMVSRVLLCRLFSSLLLSYASFLWNFSCCSLIINHEIFSAMCFVYKRDVHKSLLALNKNAVWGGGNTSTNLRLHYWTCITKWFIIIPFNLSEQILHYSFKAVKASPRRHKQTRRLCAWDSTGLTISMSFLKAYVFFFLAHTYLRYKTDNCPRFRELQENILSLQCCIFLCVILFSNIHNMAFDIFK